MPKQTKLSAIERDRIALWSSRNKSLRWIAQKLDRNVSTISREITRNGWGKYYVAIHAQAKATKRKSAAGKRQPLKNAVTFSYVMERLRMGWSPEQIAGRLKREYGHRVISHEAIYQYIYAEENSGKKLWEYLPRKQKRRRKKYGRKSQRGHIPDRVSIHDRPLEVESRVIAGHWEGDSIEGRAHRGGLHTQVERKTRMTLVAKLGSLTSEETLKAQNDLFSWLPDQLKKSTTVDNGKEFYYHKQFSLPVYFADPYSSFQRGTNENTNGLIRRYFPKGTDFTGISQVEINEAVGELNNKPKKCLNFATPAELFAVELRQCCDST